MDWTDISITCVCIKHSFSLPSNESTVKCVGRVTVAEKKKKKNNPPLWCEMYFSVKKVVTASWQTNIFPSVFSAPHLPPMFWAFVFWGLFFLILFWVFQHLFPKRMNSYLQIFWKSVFWEVAKKACLESFQPCYIFFGCSASLLRILLNICEVLGKRFLTNADLHCFTLFSWPPAPQCVHQRSSFHMRRIWKQAGLALSKKIIKWAF